MAIAIRLHDLTKVYGEKRGVFDLDLEVTEAEIFGFLGPNGAGKSTTIRLLLNLIRPDKGSAEVFGHDSHRESREVHRLVGYLPGEFALDAKLTGRQLVVYLGNLRGGVDLGYVAKLAERLGLDLDRPFGDYSRGNKQKVGLLQAFMHHPRLLILDEPTGGLDPLNQEAVLEMVRDAHAEGATIFFSSHILSEVEQICHQVGFIRDGRLIRAGPVHEVISARSHAIEAECGIVPDPAALAAIPGVHGVTMDGERISFFVDGDMSEAVAVLSRFRVKELNSHEPSLADIFLSLYEAPPSTDAQVSLH
jgi:ABC-2 type transport system ATP-binding protein